MHLTEERLDEYVRKGLSPVELTVVENHLSQCSECKVRVDFLAKIVESLQSLKTTPAPCPSEETLYDYVAGHIQGAEREELEEHIRHCQTCKSILPTPEELSEFEHYLSHVSTEKTASNNHITAIERLFATLRLHWYQVGFGAAAAAVALFFVFRQPPQEQPEMHERTDSMTAGVELISPDEGASLSDFTFRWRAFDDATSYTLVVWEDEDPTVSERQTTRETHFPSTQVTLLKPGKKYIWQVQANIGERMIGESETRTVTIK